MAIGRTFKESLNKAISSLDLSVGENWNDDSLGISIAEEHPRRLALIRKALGQGVSVDEVNRLTGYDPWFLEQILELICEERKIAAYSLDTVGFEQLFRWKRMGFSDQALSSLLRCREDEIEQKRSGLNVRPVFKRVDSCSLESFLIAIACFYSTYAEECESQPGSKNKILVLGSGPNRSGKGLNLTIAPSMPSKQSRFGA